MTRIPTTTKVTLTVLFGISLAVANITAAKVAWFELPLIGATAIPAGFVAFGASFLFTDLLNELYGREYAQSVVNATVIGMVLAWALIYVSIVMPAAPFYGLEAEFEAVLGGGATIITASIITMLFSQNLDVIVFDKLRSITDGGHKWLRNLGSTTISQFADTALFITLGFAILPQLFGGSVTPWAVIPGMIAAQYTVKLAVAVLDTPLFYLGSALFASD